MAMETKDMIGGTPRREFFPSFSYAGRSGAGLLAAKIGDAAAFELLVQRHERKIFVIGSAHDPQSGGRRRRRTAKLSESVRSFKEL